MLAPVLGPGDPSGRHRSGSGSVAPQDFRDILCGPVDKYPELSHAETILIETYLAQGVYQSADQLACCSSSTTTVLDLGIIVPGWNSVCTP